LAPEQFGVDLRELLQLLLKSAEVFGALTGGLLLLRALEEELVHLTHRQALGQIVEGTMLGPPVMTMALGFATSGKTLHNRSAQEVRRDVELLEKKLFAPAQSQRGFSSVTEYPCHVYGKDMKTAKEVNEKENAPRMRNCSTP